MRRTLLLACLLGTAPAFAQPRAEVVAALDPAARAKVEQTFNKYRPQLAPLRQDARKTRLALKDELDSRRPDEKKVSVLTTQLQNDRRQLIAISQERSAELKSELTPSQFARLMFARQQRR